MEKIIAPQKVYVTKSKIPNAGRGVFASEKISAGEVIEVAPITKLGRSTYPTEIKDPDTPDNYTFSFAEGYEAFALGFGAIYNHSYDPNALYVKSHKRQAIIFSARRNIDKDEEITVSYNDSNPNDKTTPKNFGVPPHKSS